MRRVAAGERTKSGTRTSWIWTVKQADKAKLPKLASTRVNDIADSSTPNRKSLKKETSECREWRNRFLSPIVSREAVIVNKWVRKPLKSIGSACTTA